MLRQVERSDVRRTRRVSVRGLAISLFALLITGSAALVAAGAAPAAVRPRS
jgi:hypothetical protein